MRVKEYKNGRKDYSAHLDNKLHGQPAKIEYDALGQIRRLACYQYGKLHSELIPAETVWNEHGVITKQTSYLRGKLHGYDLEYSDQGQILLMRHFQYGKLHSLHDLPAYCRYDEITGVLTQQSWHEKGHVERDHGWPARLDWNHHGEPVYTGWGRLAQITHNKPEWIYYTRDGKQRRQEYSRYGSPRAIEEAATVPPHDQMAHHSSSYPLFSREMLEECLDLNLENPEDSHGS